MNNVILDLIPKTSGAAPIDAAANGTGTKAGTLIGTELFRTTLADRLRTSTAAKTAKTALVPADTATLKALQAKIAKMLESGASQADVVTALATQLAASVSQSLESPTTDARAQLQTLFATALAPPGRGDPAAVPIADRALALAQRYSRLANLARSIAGQPSGQQKRIAGNVLDAQRAKDIPAPTTTTTTTDAAQAANANVQSALAAAQIPVPAVPIAGTAASTATVTTVSSAPSTMQFTFSSPAVAAAAADAVFPVLAAPARVLPTVAPSGDGRRVNIGSRAAVATGGDTGLGRILTRAVLADDMRASSNPPRVDPATLAAKPAALVPTSTAPADTAPASPPTASPLDSAVPPAQPAASFTAILDRSAAGTSPAVGSANGATADVETSAATAPNTAPSSSALAAFVHSFEAALNAADTADGVHPADATKPPLATATVRSQVDAQALGVPPVVATAGERIAPATAPTASAGTVPVDHSAIADQVLRGAFLRNTGTSSEIRLSLLPEALGDVSVKLVVTAGSVAAHVVAETPAVRDALIAAQPQLTKSLADAGLKLTSFNVDLSGGGFAGFSQQQNAQSQNEARTRRSTSVFDSDDATGDAQLAAIPSFGPPASTTAAGDYNYLA
jgi:flagellar hook-length control protein FliK